MSRPNILVLFTDQLRADAPAALGNPTAAVRTPHMDRLVREGTTFTSAYTPSPVCCPARCCTHYGRYPQVTGLFENGPMPPEHAFVSYPELLGRHGYRTHAVGKCHFTPDRHALRGFGSRRSQEECIGDISSDDYLSWLAANGLDTYEPSGARGQMYYVPQVSSLPEHAHPTAWVGEESSTFVREAAGDGQPWCLFASFIHPHPPFSPPKPWHKLYHVSDFAMPEPPGAERGPFCWVNRHQNRYKYRDGGFDAQMIRLIRAYYSACVSFVDFQIGRILAALESTGQLDHTLIVFTSDHGELLGDYGCFGKRSMHDASARIPLVARHPGRFAAGTTCASAASLVDLFPTVAAAAGVDPGAEGVALDGTDLAALAQTPDPGRIVFSQLESAGKGIYLAADARGKFVHSAGDQQSWFFDRTAPQPDDHDLGADPTHAPARERLERALLTHLDRTGRTEAVEGASDALRWRPYPHVDESWIADPNANLLHQDYPPTRRVLAGYTDRAL